MSKPASAFASSMQAGRSLSWEALVLGHVFESFTLAFNNVAYTSGGRDIRYAVLVPANVSRGAVTLERMKVQFALWILRSGLNSSAATQSVPFHIALTPVQNGNIVDEAVLNPVNTADTESNRIIWRHTYTVAHGEPVALAALGDFNDFHGNDQVWDVKSRRRFERANWALILTTSVSTIRQPDYGMTTDIRALFRAPDGL